MSNRVLRISSKDNYIRSLSASFQHLDDKDDEDELDRFLKPLFTFFKFLGINMNPPPTHRNDKGVVNCCKQRNIGWLIFAMSVTCNIFIVYSVLSGTSQTFDRMTSMAFTLLISLISDMLFKFFNHLALLRLASGPKILTIMKTIRRLSFKGLKIRQYSNISLFIFLSVSFL